MSKVLVAVGRLLPVKGRVFEPGIESKGREASIEYVDENDIKRSAYHYVPTGRLPDSFDFMFKRLATDEELDGPTDREPYDTENFGYHPTLCDACGNDASLKILDEWLCKECIYKDAFNRHIKMVPIQSRRYHGRNRFSQ